MTLRPRRLAVLVRRVVRDWWRPVCGAALVLVVADPLHAANPWETAVSQLRDAFVGPIAKALALVSIVVGGLIFAYGEGQGKKTLAGIIFGLGMALGAVQFMNWLFPTAAAN